MNLEGIRREAEAFVSRNIARARTQAVRRWLPIVQRVPGPLPPAVVLQLIASESGGNPLARSSHPEFGLLQLVEDEIRRAEVDWRDPLSNVYAAQREYARQASALRSSQGVQPSDLPFLIVLARSIGGGATRRLLSESADLSGGTAAGRMVQWFRNYSGAGTDRPAWTGRQSLALVARRVFQADDRIRRAPELDAGPVTLGTLDVSRPGGIPRVPFADAPAAAPRQASGGGWLVLALLVALAFGGK